MMTMIIWSFGFLRMGTVGVVAQAYGKSDYREIVKTLLRNFIIALIGAFIIIIFTPLIKIAISHFFSPSVETEILINNYLNIRVFSVPAELIIYIMIGFYLGIQKTKISSFIIVTLSILNIVFSSVSGKLTSTLTSSFFLTFNNCLSKPLINKSFPISN